jgi:hypothetical protein
MYSIQTTANLSDTLLHDYTDIFEEPRGLPPQHHHYHQIHLLPSTTPVVVCPYQYPQMLKDEME